MAFVTKVWHDLPTEDTPLSAEAMDDLETRLSNIGFGGTNVQTGVIYTAEPSDVVVGNPVSGGITINLPAAAQSTTITVISGSNINLDNELTIAASAGIKGAQGSGAIAGYTIHESYITSIFTSDGTYWYLFNPRTDLLGGTATQADSQGYRHSFSGEGFPDIDTSLQSTYVTNADNYLGSAGVFGLTVPSGTRTRNDVALYALAEDSRTGAGYASGIWAFNAVANMLEVGVACRSAEFDINNAADSGVVDMWTYFPPIYGVEVVNGGSYRGSAAIEVENFAIKPDRSENSPWVYGMRFAMGILNTGTLVHDTTFPVTDGTEIEISGADGWVTTGWVSIGGTAGVPLKYKNIVGSSIVVDVSSGYTPGGYGTQTAGAECFSWSDCVWSPEKPGDIGTGAVVLTQASGGQQIQWTSHLVGSSNPMFRFNAAGKLEWGPVDGSGGLDTNLQRIGPGDLYTGNQFFANSWITANSNSVSPGPTFIGNIPIGANQYSSINFDSGNAAIYYTSSHGYSFLPNDVLATSKDLLILNDSGNGDIILADGGLIEGVTGGGLVVNSSNGYTAFVAPSDAGSGYAKQVWVGVLGGSGAPSGINFQNGESGSAIYRASMSKLRTDGIFWSDFQTSQAASMGPMVGGGAGALPAQPVQYLPMRDQSGTMYWIPAYSL